MAGKPSKTSQRVTRAMEVQGHYIGGMPGDIADLMGVSERTVWNDLKLARHLNREEVQAFDHEELLGKRLKVFRLIRTNALRDYQLCKEGGNAKAAFLNIALRAEEKITQLLQDVGPLVKVPERVSIEEGNLFSDPEFRRKYVALMRSLPPVGINLFVIQNVAGLPLLTIVRGIAPFVAADTVRLLLIAAVPALATWVPGRM